MSDQPSDALRDAIDRVAIDYHDADYESCLRKCSALLSDGNQTLDGPVKTSLYVFVRECCGFLLEPVASPLPGQWNCTFCGRSPPEVRLGAGPAAFICNACVDTFAKIFEASPPSS